MGYSIGKSKSTNIQEVVVNEYGDLIKINAADAALRQRYTGFLSWLYQRVDELSAEADKKEEQYAGRPVVSEDEEGNAVIDTEQLEDSIQMENGFYAECLEKLDDVFGQGIVKKYFRSDYELNPDFVPDEYEFMNFISEITDVASEVYGIRRKELAGRYGKNRKGKHSKTKTELIEEAKMKKAAGADE